MKRIILFLLLLSFAFAQQTGSGPAAIQGAIKDLCETTRSLFAVGIMLFFLAGPALAVLGFIIYKFVKSESKTAKLIGKILMVLGIVVFALSIVQVVLYLLVPSIISILTGMPVSC